MCNSLLSLDDYCLYLHCILPLDIVTVVPVNYVAQDDNAGTFLFSIYFAIQVVRDRIQKLTQAAPS